MVLWEAQLVPNPSNGSVASVKNSPRFALDAAAIIMH